MNKLKYIWLFVLPFFYLLTNVSYAEFSSTPITTKKSYSSCSNVTNYVGEYSIRNIYAIAKNYANDTSNDNYKSAYDSIVSLLREANKHIVIYKESSGQTVIILYSDSYSFGVVTEDYSSSIRSAITKNASDTSDSAIYIVTSSSYYSHASGTITTNNYGFLYFGLHDCTFIHSSDNIKALYYSSGICWDGETYYYEAPKEEQPVMPTNSEIASAVQVFYNTIYNQPNIAFDDFIVLYDNSTGLYSYIGHTRGNAIGQAIIEPNGYYNGYKFDVQWWQFYLDEENDSWDWTNITKYNNYFLYSSQGDIDTLKYVGKDTIDNLISGGPWATSNTIIVYATNDYPVKYITFSEESPDPVVETGTIKGDQYTYDENLDITDNNYNPLDNFITVNPVITIIGNIDFDEVNKIFEENKNILIIENASWLFTANNQLFNYFSGFILFLIVLIIISRLLGG